MVANLANVDAELATRVATNLGTTAPKGKPTKNAQASPALSLLLQESGPIDGRVIAIHAGDGVDVDGLVAVSRALERAGATIVIIADHGGTIEGQDGSLAVTKSAMTTQSVEYDAIIIAGGDCAKDLAKDPYMAVNLGEAYRHGKTLAAWGEGVDVLEACAIRSDLPGVVTAAKSNRAFAKEVADAVGWHRHWGRNVAMSEI
jgi:catalase